MKTQGQQLAMAAENLVGVPFRLRGRDRETGIDCLGLVELALRDIGIPARIPATYGLRNRDVARFAGLATAFGMSGIRSRIVPGDIVLTRPGPAQHHALIAGTSGMFIHAHGSLRRVVAMPGPLSWPILHQWRLPPHRTSQRST